MTATGADSAEQIRFTGTVELIDAVAVVRLPEQASRALPSRGQVAVRGTFAEHPFRTVLEPDGRRGHWLRVEPAWRPAIDAGDRVAVAVEVTPDWPEPDVPADLAAALAAAPGDVQATWSDITSMARWEWVRWVNATKNEGTRARRVEATISKMAGGKRRPCCFDLASCTDVSVARSGKLPVA